MMDGFYWKRQSKPEKVIHHYIPKWTSPRVDSEDKKFIITIGLVLVILVGGYSGLMLYTGYSTPFSVVMSQSMQHDTSESQIGCIDTGDVVIVKEPGKSDIQSYFEALDTGLTSFGDNGSVIIYERGAGYNPVIHRAILWMDYVDGHWVAEELRDHPDMWECQAEDGRQIHDYDKLEGTLYLKGITQSEKDVEINLDSLEPQSGFLTMGDNPFTNTSLDQATSIMQNHLISIEDIKSVPIIEIPWIGAIKILIKNDGDNLEYVPNSIPSLVMFIVLLFSILLIMDLFSIRKNTRSLKEEIKKIEP